MKKTKNENTEIASILPQYGSMEQCSSHLGIPVSTIRHAKKNGCLAFKDSRIYTLPLIRWLFSQELTDDGIDWGVELKKHQAKREKVKLDKELGLTLDQVEASPAMKRAMADMFYEMDKLNEVELPMALTGRTAIEIKAILVEKKRALQDTLRAKLLAAVKEDKTNE